VIILFRRVLHLPAVTLRRVMAVVTITSVCCTLSSIGTAKIFGFPLPFTPLLSAPH
jgi:hypothetical protein